MKFKIGDKVKHKDFGVGEIVYIDKTITAMPYAVQFKIFNEKLHSFGKFGAPKVKNGHGWWCRENELELCEQQSQNLIPQIAKMLGVEIGEEFNLLDIDGTPSKNSPFILATDGLFNKNNYYSPIVLNEIIEGKWKIEKLPKKPILTEDEKTILRNIPKEYKWIARDEGDYLFIYEEMPRKVDSAWVCSSNSFEGLPFYHLFQFIKWEKVNNKQIAQGKYGKFVIERGGGFYWAKYYSPGKNFTLPRCSSIKELKEQCQNNHYWED